MRWIQNRTIWQGECPLCGLSSNFGISIQHIFPDGTQIDVIECPGESHPFVIATEHGTARQSIKFITPVAGEPDVPKWLPSEYQDAYAEMMFDFKSDKYRSAVAIAGIILDSHINSLLRNPGDKKVPLGKRMEILAQRNLLDPDQFAEGTVARLGRNEVIHPGDIAEPITPEEAKECIDAVSACLERYYKFRRSKALPAPAEQKGGELEENSDTENKQDI